MSFDTEARNGIESVEKVIETLEEAEIELQEGKKQYKDARKTLTRLEHQIRDRDGEVSKLNPESGLD